MSFHVLIVPGSWHVPAHYESTIAELKSRGVSGTTLLHPTCDLTTASITDLQHPDLNGPRKQWPDMTDDAKHVSARLSELVEAGESVLIVAHSYGGLPASEALLFNLTRKSRAAAGHRGGVIGMLALASFFLPVGVSTKMAMGGNPLPTTPEQPSGLHVILDPANNLFNDLPQEAQEHWVSLLRPQAWVVHETPASNAGFLNVPCGFLKTLDDKMTPLAGQEAGIATARGFGADVTEYAVHGGHDAFLAHTNSCVDVMVEFGEECLTMLKV